jgi:quinol monooxygenase YgiN
MFVRISKGSYAPELHERVTTQLNASAQSLVPAIRALPGCLSYFVGSDSVSNTMVNVSVWDTLEHAQAMGTLPEMSALAKEFIALGVQFERPLVNYPVLWQLP